MNTILQKFIVITILFLFAVIFSCENDKNPTSDINDDNEAVVSLPEQYNYRSLQFLDQNEGWIVGDNGIILHTSNGGKNWIKQESNTSDDLMKILFVDSECGWIAGAGKILHTEDGGHNWTEQLSDSQLSMFVDIKFVNRTTGWACGPPGGVVYATSDGGITWEKILTGAIGRIFSISFIDSDVGYACSGIIYKTIDGGKSWNSINHSSNPRFSHYIHFLNYQTGFVGNTIVASSLWNDNASIFRTDDSGFTWIEHVIPDAVMIQKIFFIDQDNGWAINGYPEYGKLLHTQNGGNNWTEMVTGDGESNLIMDFSAFDVNIVYALTTASQIIKINL